MTKAEAEKRRARIQQSIEQFFQELEENDPEAEGLEEEEQILHEERMRKIREPKISNAAKDARKAERLIQEKKAIYRVLEIKPEHWQLHAAG
jgi:hypothetical protein